MTAAAMVRIAGKNSVEDWRSRKQELEPGGASGPWESAFEDFFTELLRTRYFEPVKVLQRVPDKNGEGFSIVAIQCSLIEFLGATIEGKTYRYNPGKKIKLGEYEYDSSRQMFVRFLVTAPPFKDVFDNYLAEDFYEGVRCGLLHEARTKKGWIIRAGCGVSGIIDKVNPKAKIVYRDNLQTAFCQFVDWYGQNLTKDKELQEAFIRKFDSLCAD